jgi:predicted nucleic-acid-binding protein
MRGVDTNVLVRFVTRDDPDQFRRADALLARAAASGEAMFVDAVVACEVVWVLRSAYGHARDEVSRVLDALLETPEVVMEDADLARRALAGYAAGKGDFADLFIGWRNRRRGCETTFTFERRLRAKDLFTTL